LRLGERNGGGNWRVAEETQGPAPAMARRNGAAALSFGSFGPNNHRSRTDRAPDRPLGRARRKFGADGRTMAWSRSGRILSCYGNSVDHPIETVGEMDAHRLVSEKPMIRSFPERPLN